MNSSLPSLARCASRTRAGWESIDWVDEDDQSSIQISWSDLHVHADCRQVSYEVANRIIGVLADFGCPLYDPQVDERFDSSL